jgi:tRNA pseudouridine38-40 synthase
MPVRRLRLTLEYDGTAYHGFQHQNGQRTVQDALEHAIGGVTQEECRVVAAGRTDAGVHAVGQVVHLDTNTGLDAETLRRAVNAVLAEDIAVREVAEVEADFHARYWARRREYHYRILNTLVRSPLARRTSAHVARPLDETAMGAAGNLLVGDHDFASFGGKMWPGGSTCRTVHRLTVSRQGDWVTVEIVANAYLSRMVRAIVGCLIAVGQGDLDVAGVESILLARDRGQAKWLAPAQGLCLVRVDYADTQLFSLRSKG